MRWDVFVDLSRLLTPDEQASMFAALDEIVLDSGSIGPNRSGVFEMYFVVEASSLDRARTGATRYTDAVIEKAGLNISYEITLKPRA